jgi:perosamine synthetase
LENIPGIKIIREKPYCRSNYCYPSILLEDNVKVDRDGILKHFREQNIHARPGFPQMSCFPVHSQRFPNPVAQKVAERGISLPSAANLTEKDIDFVCGTLLNVINSH